MLLESVVLQVLQISQVLNVQLDHAGPILDALQCLLLLLATSVQQLPCQLDNGLLGQFDAVRDAL